MLSVLTQNARRRLIFRFRYLEVEALLASSHLILKHSFEVGDIGPRFYEEPRAQRG